MKNKPTLFEAWKAGWKLHIFFYPIYAWILFDMLPELFDPANENPTVVKVIAIIFVVLMGVIGLGRFAYLWYKQTRK